MEGQKGNLSERLSSTRKERKEHHKELRLSKAIIGEPIQIKEKTSETLDSSDASGGPSMVMKCVIVQRDERGYGLTVSGDNPVYVQSVKEDGAAHKAGVMQGDRIIKVNATKVTEYNHIEVVKLIKADSYVALTLLGPPAPSAGNQVSGESPNDNQSKAKQGRPQNTFFNEKVDTIKKMLLQETAEVERIKEEYARNPLKKLLNDLGTAQKLKQDLEKQLWKVESLNAITPDPPSPQGNPRVTDVDDNTGSAGDEPLIYFDEPEPLPTALNEKGIGLDIREQRSATMNDDITNEKTIEIIDENDMNNPFLTHEVSAEEKPVTPQPQNIEIINFEDDDMAESCETIRDHGPFTNFEKLRQRPSYMAVFLYYVISSHDCANLLLALTVDNYKMVSSTKDLVKTAENIFRNFLGPNAVLRVAVDEVITTSIHSAVQSKNPAEEMLRGIFDPAVQVAIKEIQTQLSQYCVKREQGLGNLFGEEKLPSSGSIDPSLEARIVDDIIIPLNNEIIQSISNATDEMEQSRLAVKADCLQAYLGQFGTKRKAKITSRMYSMLRSKPQPALTKGKISGSMESIIDDGKRSSVIMNLIGKSRRNTRNDPAAITQSSQPPLLETESGKVSSLVKQFQEEGELPDNDSLSVDSNSRYVRSERRGSFRRNREDEKRHSGPPKSHSDPDKFKVEQAVVQHNASEISDRAADLPLDVLQSMPSFADDQEMNVDTHEQHWSDTVPRDVMKSMDKKEIKRQEVINELLYTEQHHLRDLKILEKLFYEPMKSLHLLSDEELYQAFPNLRETVQLHRGLNRRLQEVKERECGVVGDIGELLLATFDGDAGNTFKEESAHYCGNQSTVLAFIKERSKKDPKFLTFIQGAQRHPICRKLHLKDFVPMEFQRLTKYPLLLENIIKNTKKKQEQELEALKRACARCREILAYVNQTVKEAEDKQQILEISNNLDRSSFTKATNQVVQEYKNIDLTQLPVVHHGQLTLRISQVDKKKEISVHCILYDEVLVVLHKQDDRYLLKYLGQDRMTHSPFIKLVKLIVRNVATDKRAFFVMSMLEKQAQMYEFAASSVAVMRQWMSVLTETATRWKETPSKVAHRREAFLVPGTSKDISDDINSVDAGDLVGTIEENHPEISMVELSVMPPDEDNEQIPVVADETDLISGHEPPTLYERIKAKQREIAESLSLKRHLLAEYAGINADDVERVLELSHLDGNPDPQAIVMHSLLCVDRLTGILNEGSNPQSTFIQPNPTYEGNHQHPLLCEGTSPNQEDTTPNHGGIPHSTHADEDSIGGIPVDPLNSVETGYHSDGGLPREAWGNPPSPIASSATMNSISEISQSETSVVSPLEENQPTHNNGEFPQNPPTHNNREFPQNPPTYEVMSQTGIVSLTKMMEISMHLQTQLTNLLHITAENETSRRKLKEENEFLRSQLELVESPQGPPTYADVMQDQSFIPRDVTSMTSSNVIPIITSSGRPQILSWPSDQSAPTPPPLPLKARRATGS